MCGQRLSSGLFCCPDLLLSAPTALRIPEKALRGSLEPEPGQLRILNRSSGGGGCCSSRNRIRILRLSGSGRDPLAHFGLFGEFSKRCVVLRWFLPALENSPKPGSSASFLREIWLLLPMRGQLRSGSGSSGLIWENRSGSRRGVSSGSSASSWRPALDQMRIRSVRIRFPSLISTSGNLRKPQEQIRIPDMETASQDGGVIPEAVSSNRHNWS